MTSIDLSTVIHAPLARVFDLAISVDAHEASMRASGEQAIAGVTSGVLAFGDTVTWRARHLGVWWRLTSRITAYQRPLRFVDEQVRGPFHRWHHEHLFSWDEAAQATLMRDVIRFSSPLGPVGRLVDLLLLGRYMRAMIVRRNRYLAWHAEQE